MPSKENIEIAVIQTHLHWEDIDANLSMFSNYLEEVNNADIVVLPEMFTTGFSMQPEKFAKESYTKGLSWLKQTSKEKNTAIVGSVMAEDSGTYYNRLLFVTPEQDVYGYDKKHLFSLGNEQKHYAAGEEDIVIDYLGWKIKPLICYDLRFPEWNRNTTNYDLAIYVANWPQKRIHHWRSLLIARAIENQCYVVASNRVGNDDNNISHNGNSAIIDYNGTILTEETDNATVLYQSLAKEKLSAYRRAFPFLSDMNL